MNHRPAPASTDREAYRLREFPTLTREQVDATRVGDLVWCDGQWLAITKVWPHDGLPCHYYILTVECLSPGGNILHRFPVGTHTPADRLVTVSDEVA